MPKTDTMFVFCNISCANCWDKRQTKKLSNPWLSERVREWVSGWVNDWVSKVRQVHRVAFLQKGRFYYCTGLDRLNKWKSGTNWPKWKPAASRVTEGGVNSDLDPTFEKKEWTDCQENNIAHQQIFNIQRRR